MNKNEEEINQIMSIWKDSTIKGHSFIPKQYWIDIYEKVKNQYIPASETYVYEEDGVIQGFISILENNFIGALFIHVDYQNKGIGRKLIEYVKDKYFELQLAVYKNNETAVKFYTNNGFKVQATNLDETTGEEEYIMKL